MALRADDVNLGRDRILVELFQSGDHRAFDDLYSRYFQRIYRFCLKRVGDPHEAEELAQEAMVRAYSAMPRLRGDRRFYPWLTVIASRLCVDSHRRRGRTSPTAHVELGVVDGGQEDVVAQVDRDMLAKALDRMSPRHRQVLRLREEEGWSYDRIARHLGVGVGTIEALLFRARRALRREFHAIAGAEGKLAGLPVIGWLMRRTVELRSRASELANQAAPMFAAGAMSVAVVVGGAAIGSGGSAAPAQAAAAPTGTIRMPPLASLSGVAATGGAFNDAALGAPAPPQPSKWVQTTGAVGGTTPEEAHRYGDRMPFQAQVGPIWIAADPLALAELVGQ